MMGTKVLFVAAALVGSVLASCDDSMVRCYAGERSRLNNYVLAYAKADDPENPKTCFGDDRVSWVRERTADTVPEALRRLPTTHGLMYIGVAWASKCFSLFGGCDMCSKTGTATIYCREKFGLKLPSGEMIFGGCGPIGSGQAYDEGYDPYQMVVPDDASEHERQIEEWKAVQWGIILPPLDIEPNSTAMTSGPGAKSFAPSGKRAWGGSSSRRRKYRGKKFEKDSKDEMFAKRGF